MRQQVEIQYGDRSIGTAQISKEGLYYRFECRCRFSENGINRLHAYSADKKVCLGVCVPTGDEFGIITRIPARKLGTGVIRVVAEGKDKDNVFPIDQRNPFPRIADLDNALLCLDGIQIIVKSQDLRDNDLNQECPHK